MKSIFLGLSNYYGSVMAVKKNKKYWLELEDHSDTDTIEISKKLYKALKKEFKDKEYD